MKAAPIAIQATGLVSSVGLDVRTSCAAIRAKLTNPSETRFVDPTGEWILGHAVPLPQPWRGLSKLAHMAASAIEECLRGLPKTDWSELPLLLCLAEQDRPGRPEHIDDALFTAIQDLLDVRFSADSVIISHGRVSTAVAMAHAGKLLGDRKCDRVLVAATDSLLTAPTLLAYGKADRLLTRYNSNGFMPGEAGAAVLFGRPGTHSELRCTGIGFGVENSHIDSEEPLRASGLSEAIKQALAEAGCEMHDLDFRITDIAGEQYYFKEAALALSRTLRRRKETFDLWHPSECIGETGSAAGLAVLAVADAACRKRYGPGNNIMAQLSNDNGRRAAAVLQFVGAP